MTAGSRRAGARARARSAARRRAGEDLEAAVELQRVGRDRDRVLARGAQPVGERDRDRGLADAGRAEERDDGGGGTRRSMAARRRVSSARAMSRPHRHAASRPSRTPRVGALEAARRPRARPRRRARATSRSCSPPARTSRRPRRRSRRVHEALEPDALIGCGAGGVLGAAARDRGRHRASRSGPRALGDGAATPFHAAVEPLGEGARRAHRAARPRGRRAARSCSPTRTPSRPTRSCARSPSSVAGVPLLGGLASARPPDGDAALFLGDEVARRTARSACASTASRSCRASPRARRRSAPS